MAEKSFAIRLTANISAYKAAMAEASKATEQFAGVSQARLTATGEKLKDVGGKMTSKLTLPLVAVGGAAAKMFGDFDASMTKIVSLVGLSADEVDGMRDSVLDLAGQTAKSPQELADALFVVTSAGLRGSEAMDALDSAAKASAAGLGQTNDIARAVAGTLNAYGPGVLSAADATDILTATARAGNFETSQLAGSLGRVLPFAKQAGASFADVGGAVALMTRMNGDAAQSITDTTALLKAFVVPTQEAVTMLGNLGLTAGDVRDSIGTNGLVATLQMLSEKLGGNNEALGRIIGSSEGVKAAYTILDATAEDVASTFGVTADAVGMTNDAFATTSETGAFKVKQAWTDIQVALIEAGAIILPIIAGVAGAVAGLATAFADLPTGAQYAVLGFLAIVAAVGPVLNVLGTLLVNIGKIRIALALLKTAMIAHPLIAFGMAVAAVGTALFLAADRGRGMREAVSELADEMETAGDKSAGFVSFLNGVASESDVLAQALDAAGVTTAELARAVEAGGDEFDAMRSKILDGAKANGVNGISLELLAGSLGNLTDLLAESNAEYDRNARVLSDATESSDEHKAALGRAAASARLTAEATDKYGASVHDLTDAQDDNAESAEMAAAAQAEFIDSVLRGVSAVFDYELSLLDLTDAARDHAELEAETAELMADSSTTAEEKAQALDDLRRSTIGVAGDALAAAQAYAREQGAMDGTTRSAQLQIDELARLAQKYPELKDEIGVFIGELLKVPRTVNTSVGVEIGGALSAVDQIQRRIDALRGRSVVISATSRGANFAMADGGIVNGPTEALIGEAGREVVLPLTRPDRMRELVNDPSVMPAIAAAFGSMSPASSSPVAVSGGGGGGGYVFAPVVNVTAGMGADGVEVGRMVIDAITRAYQSGAPRIPVAA